MGGSGSKIAPPRPRTTSSSGTRPGTPAAIDLFALIDCNSSGSIELDELTASLLVGCKGFTYTQIERIFASLDQNKDGSIEQQEFARVKEKFPDEFLQAERAAGALAIEMQKWPLLFTVHQLTSVESEVDAYTKAGLPVKVHVSHLWSEERDDQPILVSIAGKGLTAIGSLRGKDLSEETLLERITVATTHLFTTNHLSLPLPSLRALVLPPQPPLMPLRLRLKPADVTTMAGDHDVTTMAVPGTRVYVPSVGCGTIAKHDDYGSLSFLVDSPDAHPANHIVRLRYEPGKGPFSAQATPQVNGMVVHDEEDGAASAGADLPAKFLLPPMACAPEDRLLIILPVTSGHTWTQLAGKPEAGLKLTNNKLADMLRRGQLEFDTADLDDCGLKGPTEAEGKGLTYDSYIQVEPEDEDGTRIWFQPTSETTNLVDTTVLCCGDPDGVEDFERPQRHTLRIGDPRGGERQVRASCQLTRTSTSSVACEAAHSP